MDGVKTLKQLENMNTCDTCNKQYKHKRSLDRHMKEKHIQREITESQIVDSQPEAEYGKSIRAFVLQFLDFWDATVRSFPCICQNLFGF
jgi:putative heme iron utilization protein